MPAGARKRQRAMYESLKQTKKAIRRDGWNRGVRAAISLVRNLPDVHDVHSAAILLNLRISLDRMVKPKLENPNFSVYL